MTVVFSSLTQIGVAALGGLIFHVLNIPAAWLSGAMMAVVVWGALGRARPMARPLVDLAMVISGATMGAAITPEALSAMSRYPLSLLLLTIGVVGIAGASTMWLTRMSGWKREDAVLASVPGALSTVLAIAADRKADVGSIAVVQSVRLLVLILVLPSIVVFIGGGDGSMLLGQGQPIANAPDFALTLVGGLALGLVFERLRVTAALLLGATVVSTMLHVTNTAPGVVPPVVATGGLVLIGAFVGERFRTLNGEALKRTIPAALGSCLISMVVAALFAGVTMVLVRVGLGDALVAFAPGGLEAMMVLAVILGLDPLYVGTHHLARFLGIAFALPLVMMGLRRGS